MLVRCLLLCWTGDYLAQSEVGKFITGGKMPCRRDKLKGIVFKEHLFIEFLYFQLALLHISGEETGLLCGTVMFV